ERGDSVTAAWEMLGIRVADDISSRANQAEFLLATLTRQLDESVSIQLNALDSRLQSAVIEINGALDDTSERARLTLSTAGQDSLNLFDTRLTEITSLLDDKLHALDNVLGDKGEHLVARLDQQNTSFAARANVLEMALNEESGRFNDVVAERTRELNEALGAKAQASSQSLSTRTREIADSLDGHAGIIAEALDHRTGALDQMLASRAAEMADSIQLRTAELENTLTNRAASVV